MGNNAARRMRRMRDERGAAAVEFGLVATLLVTILLGILQFGIYLWCVQTGAHAAREAARSAAVDPCNTAKIELSGSDALTGAPTTSTPDITVSRPSPVLVGDEVTVSIHFTTVDLGFFPGFDGVVDKSATTRVENVPAGGC